MEIKSVKFGLRFYSTVNLRRIRKVVGINSALPGGLHALLWDFDDVSELQVLTDLKLVQDTYKLPNISVIKTPNGFHAYCFHAVPWHIARGIIGMTPSVDGKYLAVGISRGYFTLRRTPIEEFKHVTTLRSYPGDVDYKELNSGIEYTQGIK